MAIGTYLESIKNWHRFG